MCTVGSGCISRDAVCAQNTFEKDAASTTYHGYRFLDGALRRIVEIQDELDTARPSWLRHWYLAFVSTAKDEQDVVIENASKKMAALDETIRAWAKLPADLAILRLQVDAIRPSENATSSVDLAQIAPKLVARAEHLLAPTGSPDHPLDPDEAAHLVAEVPQTTTALALIRVAVQIGIRLSEVEPNPVDDADYNIWIRARQVYRQARAELVGAESAEEVANARIDELLQTARRLGLQLIPAESVWEPQSFVGVISEAFGPSVGAVPAFRRLGAVVKAGVRRGRVLSIVWVLLAFAVAMWTGLSALYLDKAWGVPRDYFAMFVWALGVGTVVPTLFSALQEFAAGPLPLKTATDAHPSST